MKIAITGSIGSGKSSVGSYVRSHGYTVIDTDRLVHEFYQSNNRLFASVVDVFGMSILNKSGEIDRKSLGDLVFQDPRALKDLESIVYPAVAEYIQGYETHHHLIFFEVPMLFESEMDGFFDDILMIDTDRELALNRLEKRGMSRSDALKRLAHQMDPLLKIEKSDKVIHNNGSIVDLYREIDCYLEALEGTP